MKLNFRTIGNILLGLMTGAITFVVLFIAWGYLGFRTGVWIDGCPDIVAAHEPVPIWWEISFSYVIPPIMFLVAVYAGIRTSKRKQGIRPDAGHGKN